MRPFADARSPNEVRSWVGNIVKQNQFDRIIASHFASPMIASPGLFAGAFEYLNVDATPGSLSSNLPSITCAD